MMNPFSGFRLGQHLNLDVGAIGYENFLAVARKIEHLAESSKAPVYCRARQLAVFLHLPHEARDIIVRDLDCRTASEEFVEMIQSTDKRFALLAAELTVFLASLKRFALLFDS